MTGRLTTRMMYTVTESAELLGISRSTAYQLVASGDLPTVWIGRRRMITRPTLTTLLGVEPPLPAALDALRASQSAPPTAHTAQWAAPECHHGGDTSTLPVRAT